MKNNLRSPFHDRVQMKKAQEYIAQLFIVRVGIARPDGSDFCRVSVLNSDMLRLANAEFLSLTRTRSRWITMSRDFVKAKKYVTDPAKLDVIATTQAKENERHRSEVSRSFVCMYAATAKPLYLYFERSGHIDRYVLDECARWGLSDGVTQFPPRRCKNMLFRPH
jgi:hypothetical protein